MTNPTQSHEQETPTEAEMGASPENIYLQWYGERGPEDCSEPSCAHDDVTWCKDQIFDNDIKYVRFDVHSRELAAKDAEVKRLQSEYGSALTGNYRNHLEIELRAENESLKQRSSRLEAVLIEMLKEAALTCDYYADRAKNDWADPDWGCEEAAKVIRALPLPDTKANALVKLKEAAKVHYMDHCNCGICEAVREYEASK